MRDTTAPAEEVRLAAIRAMAPAARVRQAFELSEFARTLAVTRIRAEHPDWTTQQVIARFVALTHGVVLPVR